MMRPVSVPPVKAITSTSSLAVKAAPVTWPRPLTILITPSGKPASDNSSIKGINPSGVSSDGLSTQLLPKAIAPASFMLASAIGAFQGAISPATPTGSRRIKVIKFGF